MKVVLLYCGDYPRVGLDYTLAVLSNMKDVEVYLLSDITLKGVNIIPLSDYEYPAKGVWEKLEIFSHPELGRVIYIDLDFLFLGGLEDFWNYKPDESFILDRLPKPDGSKHEDRFCTGFMRIDLDKHTSIWDEFLKIRDTELLNGERRYQHDELWLNSLCLNWTVYPEKWITYCKWGLSKNLYKSKAKLAHFNGERDWWSYYEKSNRS